MPFPHTFGNFCQYLSFYDFGQIIFLHFLESEDGDEKFIPGQVINDKFVPGIIVDKVFIPGQVLRTDNGKLLFYALISRKILLKKK